MSDYYLDGQIPSYRSSDLTKTVKIDPESNQITITDTITNKVLNINSQQLSNNSGQSLLFSDIYATVNKTTAITYPPTNANTLNVNNSIVLTNGTITNTLSNVSWSGTSSNASAVNLTSDNTSGTYYIPFSKTITANTNVLYIDNVTGPLSYNPSTSALSCLILNGRLTQPITQNTATYTSSTLTLSGSNFSFINSNIIISGTSNTISALTLTGMIVGGEYNVGIYNSGSGNLTINTGLGTNIKTIHSTGVNISSSRYALMKINVLTINALTIYIVQVNQLTN